MEINGINLEDLDKLLKEIEINKELVKDISLWKVRVRWMEAFRSIAYIRNHVLKADEPSSLSGVDTSPNAVEYLLASLGFCITVGYVYNATRRGIRIKNLEISLEGKIDNILKFLRISDEGSSGFKEIKLKLYVKAEGDKEKLKEIFRETLDTSPVTQTLLREVKINPEISIIE